MLLPGLDALIFMAVSISLIEMFPVTKTPISYMCCAFVYLAVKAVVSFRKTIDFSYIERKFSTDVSNSATQRSNALIINVDGKQIFVPFSRSIARRQIGKRYFYVDKDGNKQEFSPYHGVPFLVKPSDIGCDHISVVNEMDDSQENIFDKND